MFSLRNTVKQITNKASVNTKSFFKTACLICKCAVIIMKQVDTLYLAAKEFTFLMFRFYLDHDSSTYNEDVSDFILPSLITIMYACKIFDRTPRCSVTQTFDGRQNLISASSFYLDDPHRKQFSLEMLQMNYFCLFF